MSTLNGNIEIATLGGGCFWCTEAVFQLMDGVISVVSGYSGGHIINPPYREICEGRTGHAEVIQIAFDRSKVSFSEILRVFFVTHDPTQLNRQGNDIGPQYRSVIFYHNDEQCRTASEIISELNTAKVYTSPIVTEVSPLINFFQAEDYHQNYYSLNSDQPYCSYIIAPKIAKFKKIFSDRLKK